ncbi:exosortase H-associated membrane protein [Gilvimarinus xylanilyticus]|uniref:Uncharacterized protein n=1 Tax=Gilvimarinus xylanilyticus TaxID=2944139 RepID=A0A9X2I5V7_9GAMM|nr:exosortase H-associated membrane protein [Gilvimarinus xylanilyticus]MCP8900007.1 hypothetical protein [Gilvimarinus xylanilyticus]
MPRRKSDPLLAYFGKTLLWLPLFFLLWYYLAAFFSVPAALLAKGCINLMFSGLVETLEMNGRELEVITALMVNTEKGRGNVVVSLNPLIYSWNIPVLLALCFAVEEQYFSNPKTLLAVIALLPLHAFGIGADLLASLAFKLGPEVAGQLPLQSWQHEAIALAYQFGYLILPVVGASAIWLVSQYPVVSRLAGIRPRESASPSD